MSPRVYVITWCQSPADLETAVLTFETIRVGFPTCPITVVDNASFPAARQVFQQKAKQVGADFLPLNRRIRHHMIIEEILNRQREGTAVVLDPDLCFWQTIEHWSFTSLLAGRLLPKFRDPAYNCIAHPRLHTSCLWINDIAGIGQAVREIGFRHPDFSPFRQIMVRLNEDWQWWDTGAALYAAIPERMHAFGEVELNAYDHLFCGTHASLIQSKADQVAIDPFLRSHAAIKQDRSSLRGAWRWQDEYFQSLAVG